MRSFSDLSATIGRVPADVVTRLSAVDVGRGSEALYRDQMPGLLHLLADRARVASITASSAIEGVVVADANRAERILQGRVRRLRSRSEQELAGYRDAQDYLFQDDWHPLSPGLLLHLHRLLFRHTASAGGRFKSEDNLVVDRASDGSTTVRFRPVPAKETEFYVAELVDRYAAAVAAGQHHPVLLIGGFVLDLLVVHPFEDGNGRVARALTNALLVDRGYTVSRYVSLEELMAGSEDAYYQALLDSTHGWHDDKADPWPWLRYFVSVLADAYAIFSTRTAANRSAGSKQDRVRDYLLNHAADEFRIADVRTALPGVSDQTIRLVLDKLRAEGAVTPQGLGRTATWRRTNRPPD
ncbi:Fic family protein [Phytohabitans sp. ZYX-F-186]|uniref:Fic family protein n=1 Tax=Phytohabitans maris TaxID=3071409 RepID=A0ABU0ZB88_9ACTN|nr:Fic family protein [Phytohabitans sp. ZYX-F-186]MDQ7904317.1 Fic family protein [Phytohabitans sp. ZYX-F-186]